ncbi:MAG: sulfatase-like hydrolase/transferase, partial [Planctomycetota bacterium]
FEEARKWIAVEKEQPFFSYIALNAAHSPLFVPDRFRQPIRDAIAANPDVTRKLSPQRLEMLISFLAMGANIDENIGGLDHFLKEQQLFDNTIVVFLTDNGSTMGAEYFNVGMRGKKTQLWEGGHRVPCFIRWPDGSLGTPRDVDPLCHVQDLMPTLADLAGIDVPSQRLDGVSLSPIFRGQRDDSLEDRMLVINYSRMPGFKATYTTGNPAIPQRDGAAVMWRHWRLLENKRLYNVKDDVHQDRDIAAAHPDVVAKLRDHLNSWWDELKDDVATPRRVIIGSEAENPMLLTACEWLDVFVDQQGQVRRGVLKNGTWHLSVARPGRYRLELRRWPRESGAKLNAALPALKVTDGTFSAGKALAISSATVTVNDRSIDTAMDETKTSFKTTVELPADELTMRTQFFDVDGKEICGAYYVYVERIEGLSNGTN